MEEFETDDWLSEIYYEKRDTFKETLLKEIKLEKLGITEITINAVKKSFPD